MPKEAPITQLHSDHVADYNNDGDVTVGQDLQTITIR